MRVFEVFTCNLKDVKFKDTKKYFDSLLEALNISYAGVVFCFNGDFSGKVCKRIAKTLPQLSEYIQRIEESARYFKSAPDHCFSSISNRNGLTQLYVKREHIDDFEEVLKRIPTSLNFAFMGVLLDNVNWYGDGLQKPIFYSESQDVDYYNHQFNAYYSNSIRFFKEFDFGNKFNLVEVVIERRMANDELLPYPNVFSELLKMLNSPMRSRLECVFSETEKKIWLESSNNLKDLITVNGDTPLFNIHLEQFGVNENSLIDSVTPIRGFSPKTVFEKTAKAKGFAHFFSKNGCYRYRYVNSNNHFFEIEIQNIPFSSFFVSAISASGYNFKEVLHTINQVTIKDAASADIYAKYVFDLAVELEMKYAEILLSFYGQTPAWYLYY